MKQRRSDPSIKSNAAAFSLVEASVATILVGGLFVVALNCVGAVRLTESRFMQREKAAALGEMLLSEILVLPYRDPQGGLLGLDLGEVLSLRPSLDDMDDYDGYADSPPLDAAGQPIAGADAFRRSVRVERVQLNTPGSVTSLDTGVVRLTVSVYRGNQLLSTRQTWAGANWPRGSGWVEPLSP